MEKVRLAPSKCYPKCQLAFVVNGKKFEGIRMPFNPLFEICEHVHLKGDDSHLETVLKILAEQDEEVNLNEVESTKKLAKQYFGVELEVDAKGLSRTLIKLLASDTIDVSLLDNLRADTICDALEHAYNRQTEIKHETVNGNMQKFIDSSKKTDTDKKKLQATTSNLKTQRKYREKTEFDEEAEQKSSKKQEEEGAGTKGKKQQSEKKRYVEKKEEEASKPARGVDSFEDFRQKRSELREKYMDRRLGKDLAAANEIQEPVAKAQKSSKAHEEPRNFDDKKHFDVRRLMKGRRNDFKDEEEKAPHDDRILLGLYGETPLWWREQNRPARVPAL